MDQGDDLLIAPRFGQEGIDDPAIDGAHREIEIGGAGEDHPEAVRIGGMQSPQPFEALGIARAEVLIDERDIDLALLQQRLGLSRRAHSMEAHRRAQVQTRQRPAHVSFIVEQKDGQSPRSSSLDDGG
jgi:hypothetical protein